MNENEKKAVIDMFVAMNTNFAVQDEVRVKQIMEKFFRDFTGGVQKEPAYFYDLLETAFLEKSPDDVEFSLIAVGSFGYLTTEYIGLLIKLMDSDWHHEHETIASIFQDFKSPETVDCLYRAALKEFEYLAYDDAHALAIKCIWALLEIHTEEAREKLELLAQSDIEAIRERALKRLGEF